MCFHSSMSKKAQALAARYGRKTDILEIVKEIIEEQYHTAAYYHPLCPIVTSDVEIQAFQWGLIPFWVKPKGSNKEAIAETIERASDIQNATINARAETIFEKPSFREPIKSRRCLIPSTGFFEYQHHPDKTTTPYFIFVKSEEIFSLGGIWDYWSDPETGKEIGTFSIITTSANPLIAHIHNGGKNPYRMPLILPRELEERWLDPKLSHTDIMRLMQPFGAEDMDAYPVRKDFSKLKSNDPAIVERIAN